MRCNITDALLCLNARIGSISGISLIPSTFFFLFFSFFIFFFRLQSTFSMQLLVDSKPSQWIASLSMVYTENFLFYGRMFTFILVQLPMINEACSQGMKRLRNIYRKNATRTGLTVDAVQHLFAILNLAKCNRMALMTALSLFLSFIFFFFLFFVASRMKIPVTQTRTMIEKEKPKQLHCMRFWLALLSVWGKKQRKKKKTRIRNYCSHGRLGHDRVMSKIKRPIKYFNCDSMYVRVDAVAVNK